MYFLTPNVRPDYLKHKSAVEGETENPFGRVVHYGTSGQQESDPERADSDFCKDVDNVIIRPEAIQYEVGGSSEEVELRTRAG